MKVKKLIEILQEFKPDDNIIIELNDEVYGEFRYEISVDPGDEFSEIKLQPDLPMP